MSDNAETEIPVTPASPNDRRRKRSIVFGSQPIVVPTDAGIECNDVLKTVEPDNFTHSLKEKTDDDQSLNSGDQEHYIITDDDTLKQNEENNNNCSVESGDRNAREEQEFDNNESMDDEYNIRETVPVNNKQDELNDIIYDETKPKRLPNPKQLKLDFAGNQSNVVRESIDVLISPNEIVNTGRRRGQSMTEAETGTIMLNNENKTANNTLENYKKRGIIPSQKAAHYERSPEPNRKLTNPSPVQRMIVRNGSPSTAHHVRRKISSDARIGSPHERIQLNVIPRRRISSDGRLDFREPYENNQHIAVPTVDQFRKRKVSFDTTALVNGNAYTPLNDELHVEEDDVAADRASPIPDVFLTVEDEITHEEKTQHIDMNSEYQEKEYDLASGCYDNNAYIADDAESCSSKTSTPPPGYNTLPERRFSSTSQQNEQDHAAIIQHTELSNCNKAMFKKLSSSSLPACLGNPNGSNASLLSENGTPPKSILKKCKDDSESIRSDSSQNGKTFKVRKDSLALFSDKNGEIALQEIQKKYSNPWKRWNRNNIKQMWINRRHFLEKYKLHLLVLMLFSMTLTFVIIGLHFHSVHHKNLATSQKIIFEARQRKLYLHDIKDLDTLSGHLGLNMPQWKQPSHCHSNYKDILDKTCLRWKGYAQLNINHFAENTTQCYNLTWQLEPGHQPFDCFDIGQSFWYGPVNMSESEWPIKSNFEFTASRAKHHNSGTFSYAIEYYWISSNGAAIILDSDFPLEINWNKRRPGQLCLIGKKHGNMCYPDDTVGRTLRYTVCNGLNIAETQKLVRQRFLPSVEELPDRSLLESPHWSSVSASENGEFNGGVVKELANAISENKLNCSTIEIDGKWQKHYGDFEFDKYLFNDTKNFLSNVTDSGCDLSLNIYPYFNLNSSYFKYGLSKGYFVKDVGKTVPALLKWQHGVGVMLDISNTQARDWLRVKLRDIKRKYDIDTFRLAYGTSAWLPHIPVFHEDHTNPNKLKQMFTDVLSTVGNSVLESTSQSQHIYGLIGIPSSISKNNEISCLKNIIPDILNLGIMGYPFIMADGFEMPTTKNNNLLPSRDLFIRWMQLSSFLPAMKYTITPWSYDTEVVEAARKMASRRKNILDAIYEAEDKILKGMPIIAPLWWHYSNDVNTYTINDQFIVAGKYLVAPVLCEGMVEHDEAERDIYVPQGVWQNTESKKMIHGPKWVRNFQVKQFEIPFFEEILEYKI